MPRARDSGGSGSPRISVNPILPSTENKSLGIRNDMDFGAESSRPTSSLSTLLFRRSPDERQDSLPTSPLRLWPDWTFTSWILSKGFIRSLEFPFPKLCLARCLCHPPSRHRARCLHLSYACAPFEQIQLLTDMVSSQMRESLALDNGCTLSAYPCSGGRSRNPSARCQLQ